MIGVMVQFTNSEAFDLERFKSVAARAAKQFEGMPGLRSKAFTIDAEGRQAVNFYLWDDEEAARNFFNEDLVARVRDLYGQRPKISFLDVLALVENI